MGKKQILAVAVLFVMVFSFTVGFYATAMAIPTNCCSRLEGQLLGVLHHDCNGENYCDCMGLKELATNCAVLTNPDNCELKCYNPR